MSSLIDATVPADNVKADKALLRQNFQVAKNEITDLQNETSIPRVMAVSSVEMELENVRNINSTTVNNVTILQGQVTTLQTNVTNLQNDMGIAYRMAFDDAQFRTA